jgi:hypothetical protein
MNMVNSFRPMLQNMPLGQAESGGMGVQSDQSPGDGLQMLMRLLRMLRDEDQKASVPHFLQSTLKGSMNDSVLRSGKGFDRGASETK